MKDCVQRWFPTHCHVFPVSPYYLFVLFFLTFVDHIKCGMLSLHSALSISFSFPLYSSLISYL